MSPADFQVVGHVRDWPAGARRCVVVSGHTVLVVNADGCWFAIPDACPHRGWSLSQARFRDSTLQCVRHGWEFDLTTGRAVFPPFGYRLRQLPIRVEGEQIEVAWVDPEIEPAH
jgi:3-phenylpropionate/trans-cinnamate dioxygenase ferredoxin subunit